MNDQPSQEENAEIGQAQSVHLLEPKPEAPRDPAETEKKRQQRLITGLRERTEEPEVCRRAGDVLSRAQTLLEAVPKIWDTNPWLLATKQGVIDLRTGTLRSGRPDDYPRAVIPTRWRGLDEPAPRFEQFLCEIFADREEGDREELIAFLQRALGYGLIGHVREHIFLMFYGEEGHNGKDTLMHVLQYVLGKAIGTVPQDVLIAGRRFATPDHAKSRLSALQRRRIVWASEPDKGARFSSEQIKLLTGSEPIVTRPLYGKEFTFTPSHLLLLLSSRKSEIDPADCAFWERICPIVFNMRFVAQPERPNERLRDVGLARALDAEASGILAWLVRGALDWHRFGLAIPQDVLRAREEYQVEKSTVADFVRDRCMLNPDAQTPASLLYKSYHAWASENGLTPISSKHFAQEMRLIEGVNWQRSGHGKFYQGILMYDTSKL